MNIPQVLQMSLAHHQAGRFDEASTGYLKILRKMPRHADALNLLGSVYCVQGDLDKAVSMIQKAIAANPKRADYCFNLGRVLVAQQRDVEAVAAYVSALKLAPVMFDAAISLGDIYRRQQQPLQACEYYQQALGMKGVSPDIHDRLGEQYFLLGDKQAARSSYEALLQYRLHLHHQNQNQNQNQNQATAKAVVDVCYNLGVTLIDLGLLREVEDLTRQALLFNPNDGRLYRNLARTSQANERYEEAIQYFQKALQLNPEDKAACNNLGVVYNLQGQYTNAIDILSRSAELDPLDAMPRANLGNAHKELGEFEVALDFYNQALTLDPDSKEVHSNILFVLSYNVLRDPKDMLLAHEAWAKRFATPEMAGRYSWPRVKDTKDAADRPLRIGYVSPDFRRHSVSYFIEPIIKHHDRSQFEVYCYAEIAGGDEVTARIKSLADGWRVTMGLADEVVADLIHEDEIDILIDLAGHTSGNRLGVFSYRSAPVQMTYLGYFTGTGLPVMDYWISDEVANPIDSIELSVEEIIRLPRCCVSYAPHDEAPEPMARDQQAPIVFGSFNDITKVSPAAFSLWSRVMQAVPHSQLLIKAQQLGDERVRARVTADFKVLGIDASRLILRGRTKGYAEHMATYHEIDIALDTIPRTGVTTTAEALWMGVPVVSLAGSRFIERLSASILKTLGLDHCISETEADYISAAVFLASDRAGLAAQRLSLRACMRDSRLCDSADMACVLEQVYRSAWQHYLDTLSA